MCPSIILRLLQCQCHIMLMLHVYDQTRIRRTQENVQPCLWGPEQYFKPKYDLFMLQSEWLLCLNLTRPWAQCFHDIKAKIKPKETSSLNIKTCKASTYLRVAEMHIAKTYSADWVSYPQCLNKGIRNSVREERAGGGRRIPADKQHEQ